MAAKDLITLTRAKQAILSITDTTYDTLLATLITAVSDAIEKYCRRDFYCALLRRTVQRQRRPPSVAARISDSIDPECALSSGDGHQDHQQQPGPESAGACHRQQHRLDAGGRRVRRVVQHGGRILRQRHTASPGDGDQRAGQRLERSGGRRPGGDYGLWPSADLYVPPSYGDGATSQGALTARGQFAELKLHTYELAGYQFDPRGWLLRAIPYTDPELLHPEDLIWPIGINNFRVQYTAGFTTIPESIQEACARWVALCWNLAQRDPNLLSLNISQSVHQTWDRTDPDHQPPRPVRALLAFRRHTVHTNQG